MILSFPHRNLVKIMILYTLFLCSLCVYKFTPLGYANTSTPFQMDRNAPKKLLRLPHVFSKVLELPFRSDADVSVEDSSGFIRFVTSINNFDFVGAGNNVRAHVVEIHPGVMKIVIRNGGVGKLLLDQLKVDVWRFRLPQSSRPELATAVVANGELVVTVPKSGGVGGLIYGKEVVGSMARVVVVQ